MTASPTEERQEPNHKVLYIVIAAVLVILAVIGLFTYHVKQANTQAQAKADQLIAALEAQGLRSPIKDQIVRVLGDDGGPLCRNPIGALLTNGAAGPRQRPVIADNNVLKDFQKFVTDLDLKNTTGD